MWFAFAIQTESIEKYKEKYVNCVGVFHLQGIYREIHEHNSHNSLAQNIQRNMQIVLAYFTYMENIEKYTNYIGIFHSQGTCREICEHNWHISLTQKT